MHRAAEPQPYQLVPLFTQSKAVADPIAFFYKLPEIDQYGNGCFVGSIGDASPASRLAGNVSKLGQPFVPALANRPTSIRPLIPEELEIDTSDGKAWLGIRPFAMTGVRFVALPPVPGLESFLELNVRTYVHFKGMPGIWFFSLDASKLIPVLAARLLFTLPYFRAEMGFAEDGIEFQFESRRCSSPPAEFQARWASGVRLRAPDVDSLAFFLVERYCFFAKTADGIKMTRVYHHPWILDEAIVVSHRSTMITALGLPEPEAAPLAYFSRSMNVEVWAPSCLRKLR